MSVDHQILELYRENPAIVDDDNMLVHAILKKYHGVDIPVETLRKVPDIQHIKRRRRYLHQYSHIKYSKEAEDRRFKQTKEHTDHYLRAPAGWEAKRYGY